MGKEITSGSENTAYEDAIKAISMTLQGDLRGIRSLKSDWVYLRHTVIDSLTITYEIVKHPAKKGSDREPVVISSNWEVGGKLIGRYFAGFQIGSDNRIHPISSSLLKDLGDCENYTPAFKKYLTV